MAMRCEPEAPVDVRVRLIDGSEVPIELAYAGKEGRTHVWQQVSPGPILRSQFDSFSCAKLPGHTSISILLVEEL